MTIYTLMNSVYTLRSSVILAYKTYREGKRYYHSFEDKALASLNTLLDVDYITVSEYRVLCEQISHVFRMYKRRSKYPNFA